MRFKKGQLVEMVKARLSKYIGYRFIVTEIYDELDWHDDPLNGEVGYKTDIPTRHTNVHGYYFAPESWLKSVNPDSDELSEFSFTELMSNIKSSNEVKESTVSELKEIIPIEFINSI